MDNIYKGLVLVLAIIIVAGFFLPWVNVESQQVGTFTKLLTGKRQAMVDLISGAEIPILANSDESRLIISIAKIFYPRVTNVDKKSFLVLIVPILAIIIFLLALKLSKNKLTNLLIGIIGIGIFAFTLYKIQSTDLDKLVLQIKIGIGMWMILYAYLAIGLVSIFNLFGLLIKGKK